MTLHEYLLEHQISQREFARLVNRSHKTVNNWVSGKTDISLKDAYCVLLVTDGYVCPHDFLEQAEARERAH